MSNIQPWPDGFDDPTPITECVALVSFFDEIIASGGSVHAYPNWTMFSLARGKRMIDFVRRGRRHRDSPEAWWEVWPSHEGDPQKLGPLFGIRPNACVVIFGFDDLCAVTERWLEGATLDSVLNCATFWDRMDTSKPLVRKSSTEVDTDDPGEDRNSDAQDAPPCPHCGRPLRTALAQQCFECGADWHA